MALARVLQITAFVIYFKGIHGQLNNLMNNPTVGQNNIKQGFQSTSSIKSVKDNLFQNENLGRATNFNSQNKINPQLSSVPQSSLSQQFPLQQQQIISQLINQQPTQISDLQQPLQYQPQSSFISQPVLPQSSVSQQPCNFMETSPSFVPVNNAANINYQPKAVTPVVQQVPLQFSQSIPISKSYVSSPSPVTTRGGPRMDVVTNLSGNYIVPMNTLPFSLPEGQIVSSIPLPYTAVFSKSNPTFGNSVVMPYPNQMFGIYENPLRNYNEYALGDEASFEFDNILSLLLSILQSPKKSSKHVQSNYKGSSNTPYTPYKMNEGSRSSSLKALLPVILNLIKERREGCGCHSGCQCNRQNKNQKDFEIQCNGGYSKKRDYSPKEEMFNNEESAEDTTRFTREHQTYKQTKNIPDVSIESSETDYDDHLSEEEDD